MKSIYRPGTDVAWESIFGWSYVRQHRIRLVSSPPPTQWWGEAAVPFSTLAICIQIQFDLHKVLPASRFRPSK